MFKTITVAAMIALASTAAIASPNDPEEMPGTVQGNHDPREAAYKEARAYCINNVSGPIAVEHGAGVLGVAGAFAGVVAGAVNGATAPMRETGRRPIYERCMTEKGFGKEVVERRPAHIKALHAQKAQVKELAATDALEPGVKRGYGWSRLVEIDPMTDRTNVTVIYSPSTKTGQKWRNGSMVIACTNGEPRVTFQFGDYLTPKHTRVLVRLDSRQPSWNVMQSSNDNTARGYWGAGRVGPVLGTLVQHSRVAVQVPVYRSNDSTRVYDLPNINENARIVATACGFAF
jgi:hypothetical protein